MSLSFTSHSSRPIMLLEIRTQTVSVWDSNQHCVCVCVCTTPTVGTQLLKPLLRASPTNEHSSVQYPRNPGRLQFSAEFFCRAITQQHGWIPDYSNPNHYLPTVSSPLVSPVSPSVLKPVLVPRIGLTFTAAY